MAERETETTREKRNCAATSGWLDFEFFLRWRFFDE